jgi:hypothetical protein
MDAKMNYDPRVESKANHICYMIGVNEGIEPSDKTRSDVFLTVRAVAGYWKEELDEIREQNHAKRWNELRLWRKRYPFATYEDLDIVMAMLDAGLYIRDFKPQGFE